MCASNFEKIEYIGNMKNLSQHPDKAYKNIEFLNSPAARNIRVQCEFTEPGERFRKLGIKHSVVFFGSARPLPMDEAQKNLADVKAKNPTEKELKIAENKVRLSKYYEATRELAYEFTKWELERTQGKQQVYICTGGGPGIMEAGNRGATEAGGKSIGLGISLPFEQSNNPYIPQDYSFEFHYFFVRKYWFHYISKAMVAFPGGFGTMDELFEVLTLIQTRKSTKRLPILLYGKEYWDDVLDFEKYVDWGVISPEDLDLFQFVDDVQEAKEIITRELMEHYL